MQAGIEGGKTLRFPALAHAGPPKMQASDIFRPEGTGVQSRHSLGHQVALSAFAQCPFKLIPARRPLLLTVSLTLSLLLGYTAGLGCQRLLTPRACSASTPFLRTQMPPNPHVSSHLGLRLKISLRHARSGYT